MNDGQMLTAAIEYARRGFHVFPLWWIAGGKCACGKCEPGTKNAGKHPVGKLAPHGFINATRDADVIAKWWEEFPDANIGIATGKASGISVLDEDPRNGGDNTLDLLRKRSPTGQLPDTPIVLTGGGGFHYYFAYHPGLPSRLGDGVEVKSDGGYVVAPPSNHLLGAYEWEGSSELDVPFATWPEFLNGIAKRKDRLVEGQSSGPIPEGWRDKHLTSQAGAMRRRGMSEAAILAALLIENDERCTPKLDKSAVAKIAWSVSRYPPGDNRYEPAAELPGNGEWLDEGPPVEAYQDEPEVAIAGADSRGSHEHVEKPAEGARGWPGPLDVKALAAREPEQPQFIISDWMPTGYATLLAGHGGVGKSLIALYLGVCCATGEPFFGLEVARRRVLYLSCEDRESILHWRLSRICSYLGVDLASLQGWLDVIDLVGADSILWERDPRTGSTTTKAYARLKQRMRDYQTEVLMIDGITDTFSGSENSRAEVKRFVNSLVALISPETGALLLVGHVSKPGVTSGEGYSGSTGWHNSARARWYLYPEMTQLDIGERPARSGDLILELQKSNLGRTDQSVRFRWDESAHLFLGEAIGDSVFDRKLQAREERAGILHAFRGCANDNIIVPAALQGTRTTFHVISLRPEFPKTLNGSGTSMRHFRRHIEELRQSGAIEEAEYRRKNRHVGAQLAITTKGLSLCANI